MLALRSVKRFYELRGVSEETLKTFFDRELFAPIGLLADQPRMGRQSGHHPAYRELICASGDLLVLYTYREDEDAVYLADIFGAKQNKTP